MNLCIDVGNTRVKIAVFNQGKILTLKYIPDLDLNFCEKIIQEYTCRQAIISSVKGNHNNEKRALKKVLEHILILDHDVALPIQNDYVTPQTLGKDRLAAVVGAKSIFPIENVLVVDVGTCITYDFISKKGVYKGGSILPGIQMRFKSMAHFTAKLPLVETDDLSSFIGNTTKTSMQTGVLFGVLHELRGFKAQYSKKFGDIQLIVTGGDTSYFESQLKSEIFAQPNLVLIGLNKILDYNIKL